MIAPSQIGPCSPLFIVSNIEQSVQYYVETLGFDCTFKGPENDVLFAVVGRGSAQIMLKHISTDVRPKPNHKEHQWARFDAFVFVSDPKALASEFADRNTPFHRALEEEGDGLFGFEVADPDGYVVFFGRPME